MLEPMRRKRNRCLRGRGGRGGEVRAALFRSEPHLTSRGVPDILNEISIYGVIPIRPRGIRFAAEHNAAETVFQRDDMGRPQAAGPIPKISAARKEYRRIMGGFRVSWNGKHHCGRPILRTVASRCGRIARPRTAWRGGLRPVRRRVSAAYQVTRRAPAPFHSGPPRRRIRPDKATWKFREDGSLVRAPVRKRPHRLRPETRR